MKSTTSEVVIIPFTTNLADDELLLTSSAVMPNGDGKLEARIFETQRAVIRIAPPADSAEKLTATATPPGSKTDSARATAWRTRDDGSVESPVIDTSDEFALDLALIAANGTTARATPIFVITKGGKPDDRTDFNAETDPEPDVEEP